MSLMRMKLQMLMFFIRQKIYKFGSALNLYAISNFLDIL